MGSLFDTREVAKSKYSVSSTVPVSQLDQFAKIYEEHSRAIFYLALRMMGDPARAEDITHDVFLKAFKKMGEFRGDANLRTWLYRIAVNCCKNATQSWNQRNVFGHLHDPTEDAIPGGTDTPLRILELKELGARIQSALNTLSEESRLLLLLSADGTLTYEEIGTLGNQSGDAVRGKLYRARRAFTKVFSKTD